MVVFLSLISFSLNSDTLMALPYLVVREVRRIPTKRIRLSGLPSPTTSYSLSDYNHEAGALAFAPQLMGWKNGSFFKFCQSQRPYEDVLTNGISINKSMLLTYFDSIFIRILIENCQFLTSWWRNLKDFIERARIVKWIHQNSPGEEITWSIQEWIEREYISSHSSPL